MSYDHWNPPPGYRKLHGDLLYLQITTLEDKKYHATASTKGFFINQYALSLTCAISEHYSRQICTEIKLASLFIDAIHMCLNGLMNLEAFVIFTISLQTDLV